eukprot:1449546-Rhodomonas_salina.1
MRLAGRTAGETRVCVDGRRHRVGRTVCLPDLCRFLDVPGFGVQGDDDDFVSDGTMILDAMDDAVDAVVSSRCRGWCRNEACLLTTKMRVCGRYAQLCLYMQQHGHSSVPQLYHIVPRLGWYNPACVGLSAISFSPASRRAVQDHERERAGERQSGWAGK